MNPVQADPPSRRAAATPASTAHYDPDPKAHPGLRAIAIIELVKGLLAVLAASGLELIGPAPLRHWVDTLIAQFRLDPDHGAMGWLAGAINPDSVHFAAAGVGAYAVLHLAESWGLWRDRAWASWLGCIAAALYLPLDVYALLRHAGWLSATVVAINLLVVWVLGRDLLKRRQ